MAAPGRNPEGEALAVRTREGAGRSPGVAGRSPVAEVVVRSRVAAVAAAVRTREGAVAVAHSPVAEVVARSQGVVAAGHTRAMVAAGHLLELMAAGGPGQAALTAAESWIATLATILRSRARANRMVMDT